MEWETNIEFIEICTIFFAGLLSHISVVGYVKIGAKNIDGCYVQVHIVQHIDIRDWIACMLNWCRLS